MGEGFSKVVPAEGKEGDAALYVGTLDYMVDPSVLGQLDIKAIVSCMPCAPDGIEQVLEDSDISPSNYHVYPLEDSAEKFVSLFEGDGVLPVTDFIHSRRSQGLTVLVHCDGGVTRSPSVVISYLLRYGVEIPTEIPVGGQPTLQLPLASAIEYVKTARPKIRIELFRSELERLERILLEGSGQTPEPPTVLNIRPFRQLHGAPAAAPLTRHALAPLKRQWNLMITRKSSEQLGARFYELFLHHGGAEVEGIFKGRPAVRQHTVFMAAMSQLVNHWGTDAAGGRGRGAGGGNDSNDFGAQLRRLARIHAPLPITTTHFRAFKRALLALINEEVGETAVSNTWRMAVEMLVVRMHEHIKEVRRATEVAAARVSAGS